MSLQSPSKLQSRGKTALRVEKLFSMLSDTIDGIIWISRPQFDLIRGGGGLMEPSSSGLGRWNVSQRKTHRAFAWKTRYSLCSTVTYLQCCVMTELDCWSRLSFVDRAPVKFTKAVDSFCKQSISVNLTPFGDGRILFARLRRWLRRWLHRWLRRWSNGDQKDAKDKRWRCAKSW